MDEPISDRVWNPGEPANFDGERAYQDLVRLCGFGPRPTGSEASQQQRQFVADHFRAWGAEVGEQPFECQHPLTHQMVSAANLIGAWFPERSSRLVIGAHSDTRPFCDEEDTPEGRSQPYLGANDGASGVAMLMELARHLSQAPTPFGVDLVLFDAEELVVCEAGEYFLGSMNFVSVYQENFTFTYRAGLLLDMVGRAEHLIRKEIHGYLYASSLTREVWNIAKQLKIDCFADEIGSAVFDDHLPLLSAGVPMIDLIDLGDPHWHRLTDTPEHCSAQSLRDVGQVVTAWIASHGQRMK